jgi:1-phosphofructokinase
MAKIITITANTATDHFIEVRNLSLGQNTVANNDAEYACGKGINVAKTIASLSVPVQAQGFVGNQSKEAFEWVESTLLHTDFTYVSGKTRTNVTLFDPQTDTETHIRTSGFTVTSADCQKFIEKLEACISKADIVVLSGSLPLGASSDFYKLLIELCHSKQAITFLDSSGEPLKQALQAGPFLVKPNQTELEEIVGRPLKNESDIAAAARDLMLPGTYLVVISRAEKGIIAVTAESTLIANSTLIPGKIISNVGCGDALVGGLAVAILQNYELVDAIKLGIACATANLFSAEPGIFDNKIIPDITQHIVIRSLNIARP